MNTLFVAVTLALAATPSDAIELAYRDAQQFQDPRGLRYIWISGSMGKGLIEDARAVSYAVNLISHSPFLRKPDVVANDKVMLIRVDTKQYTRDEKDWLGFANTWEKFSFDPKFSLFLTQGQVNLTGLDVSGLNSRRWIVQGGVRTLIGERGADALKRDGVILRLPGHLTKTWANLADLLQTEIPVVEHRYWLYRTMSSIRDDEEKRPLYRSIYGGLYYDLIGVPDTLDELLSMIGAADVDPKGKKAKDVFELIRSDRRSAQFKSRITMKPRWIIQESTRTGNEHQGMVFVTGDFRKRSIDVDQHPLANLLDDKVDAHEVIWTTPTGLHGFALFDGAGKRQDEVPPDIAKDPTDPDGRLQAGISCIRCHSTDGGWMKARNDVKFMLDTKRWDIFGDLSRHDQGDAIKRIVGLYQGEFEKAFSRGRDDYANSILATTGPWPGSIDQTDTVRQAAKRMEWIFQGYWHDQVDAKQALAEAGVVFKAKDQKGYADEFARRVMLLGDVVESPTISALRTGLEVNRAEFDLVFGRIKMR